MRKTNTTYNIQNSIFEYIRNDNNEKKGFLLSCIDKNNNVKIGWSLCNNKDAFDILTAFKIAYERAEKNRANGVPCSIEKRYIKFIERCKRYYKDKKIISAAGLLTVYDTIPISGRIYE